jgi:three-Cys-motif partner protein
MSDLPFRFDEIGYWSELKLEIVEKYGAAYTATFKKSRLKKYYIDGFSGAGIHLSRTSGRQVEGSPTRALKVQPPFDRYYFIDLNAGKTEHLRSLCGHRPDVHIHTGDTNRYLRELLPTIDYARYN